MANIPHMKEDILNWNANRQRYMDIINIFDSNSKQLAMAMIRTKAYSLVEILISKQIKGLEFSIDQHQVQPECLSPRCEELG